MCGAANTKRRLHRPSLKFAHSQPVVSRSVFSEVSKSSVALATKQEIGDPERERESERASERNKLSRQVPREIMLRRFSSVNYTRGVTTTVATKCMIIVLTKVALRRAIAGRSVVNFTQEEKSGIASS